MVKFLKKLTARVPKVINTNALRIYSLQGEIDSIKMDLLVPPTGISRIEGWQDKLKHKLHQKEDELRRLQNGI